MSVGSIDVLIVTQWDEKYSKWPFSSSLTVSSLGISAAYDIQNDHILFTIAALDGKVNFLNFCPFYDAKTHHRKWA